MPLVLAASATTALILVHRYPEMLPITTGCLIVEAKVVTWHHIHLSQGVANKVDRAWIPQAAQLGFRIERELYGLDSMDDRAGSLSGRAFGHSRSFGLVPLGTGVTGEARRRANVKNLSTIVGPKVLRL
jgi:hypothetical protein